MTWPLLLQTTPRQRLDALQQQFVRGGGWDDFALPLALFATVFVLLATLYSLQRRRRVDIDDPRKLYRRLVRRLDLSAPQRDVLFRMAADLELAHPTTLLLGRGVFEAHAQRWIKATRTVRRDDEQRIAQLAGRLFPTATESPT